MTPYGEQWSRIFALNKAGRIPVGELAALGTRHRKWLSDQHTADATPAMVQDLKVYADHLEEFGTKTA